MSEIKPVRLILQGDKELAATHKGDAGRILFQLKNLQDAGGFTQKASKQYQDGTVIECRTDVKGMDIVRITSGFKKHEEKKNEFKEEYETFPVPIIEVYETIESENPIGGYVAKNFIGKFFEYVKFNTENKIHKTGYIGDDYIELEELEKVGNHELLYDDLFFTVEPYSSDVLSGDRTVISDAVYSGYYGFFGYIERTWDFNYVAHRTSTYGEDYYTIEIHSTVTMSPGIHLGTLVFLDSAVWEKKDKYCYLYDFCPLGSNTYASTYSGGIYGEYTKWHRTFLFSTTWAGMLDVGPNFTRKQLTFSTDEDDFILLDNEKHFIHVGNVEIFDFNGKPVYMYGVEITSYIPGEPGYMFEYGIVYNRKLHRIKFSGLTLGEDGSDEAINYHFFTDAIYISPENEIKTIENFPKKLSGFISKSFLWTDPESDKYKDIWVRAGSYSITKKKQINQ